MNPFIGDVVNHLSLEWRAFLDAPVIFITGWVAIAGAMWALMKWAFGERLASKDERITARDERITWLELEVGRFKRKADWLGREVDRLTPPPLRFVLEDFTTTKQLDEFVEGVRNRAGDVILHAKAWEKGFPGLRENLRVTENIAEGRKTGAPAGMAENLSPEEDGVVRQFALNECEGLHRTARELIRYLTTSTPP